MTDIKRGGKKTAKVAKPEVDITVRDAKLISTAGSGAKSSRNQGTLCF